MAVASSDISVPPTRRLPLRFAFPPNHPREVYGVSTFRLFEYIGLGVRSRPVAHRLRTGELAAPVPDHVPFWFMPINLFGMFAVTIFITDSHLFTIPIIQASPG